MIMKYARPTSLSEALLLLREPDTIPIAGGTCISREINSHISVVDLQDLDLNEIHFEKQKIQIGATCKLQYLVLHKFLPEFFRKAVHYEFPLNIRNSASIGGLIVKCDGRSSIVTSLLALDANLVLEPDHDQVPISDFLIKRPAILKNHLIVSINVSAPQVFYFEHIARTPLDRPIVCAAISQWKTGRTRLALGGYGSQPVLVCDGENSENMQLAARSAFSLANDAWASSEYRSEMAEILAGRCIDNIQETPKGQ
jgi:CO/xanthine dehydrogenase FAD-binding subunit